jgi:hypothetical protein
VLRRAATALSGAALLTALATPAAASAGWGKPFRLTQSYTTDLAPVSASMSARGDAAVAFSTQEEDSPAGAHPVVAIRASGGGISPPFAVPGAQLVLDLAYDRSGLRLLTGTSESGSNCCSTVQVRSLLPSGQFGRAATVVGELAGATVGSLTPLPSGRLLAAVATDHGVWAAQSSPGGGFGPTHRLTAANAMPWTMASTADASGDTAVAWTETKGQQGEIAPGAVYVATGSERAAPAHSRAAFTLAAGHAVDEVGLAPAANGVTAAWIESWFDSSGTYRTQTVVADLNGGRRRVFTAAGGTGSGLALAGDARGDQVLAWRSCRASGSCTVRAAVRPAGGWFGAAQALGAIDPGQSPAASVAGSGDALVGWISSGHVLAAERRPGARGLGSPRTVSSTSYASDLALAAGTSHSAIAAWTQGTLAPDVVGAVFRGP